MSDKPQRVDVFNMPESGTYNPVEKRHTGYRLNINRDTGEIVTTGKRQPSPEWIPEGWIQVGANRWMPQWPACMYRNLNIIKRQGMPPEIYPLCHKYNELGEAINHQTCMDCTVYRVKPIRQGKPDGVSTDELFKRPWQQRLVGKPGEQVIVEEHVEHELAGLDEEELQWMEEVEFQTIMDKAPPRLNDPKHQRNRRKVQLRWVPCIHRIERTNDDKGGDCSGCGATDIVCNNPEAELFGQKLRRKLCVECPVAEAPSHLKKDNINED